MATAATVASPPSTGAPSPATDRSFFGHPRGLSTLFFTEMWERFSYYGMRALLIIFMTAPLAAGGLGFDAATASPIYALYVSSVYLLSLPGGWFADRVLGLRRAVLVGGVFIMCGHICLAIPSLTSFYFGLLFIAIGTGFLKSNVSALVGQLYSPEDSRRDAGYSIYYMGINLGAFLAPFACGWLAQSEGFRRILTNAGIDPATSWHWGFGAAALGMFCGLVQYMVGSKHLAPEGLRPVRSSDPVVAAAQERQAKLVSRTVIAAVVGVVLLFATGAVEVSVAAFAANFKYVIMAVTVGFFAWLFMSGSWTREERKRLVVITVLFVASVVFWMAFEQAGSTLSLFAERNTDSSLLGVPFPASWFQAANPLFILLFAPVLAAVWMKLGRQDPSSPAKFTIALLFLGGGFVLMVAAGSLAANGVRVSPLWLLLSYLLQTLGELCLSPVGMSAMSRLAPARVTGLIMGLWFLSISVGNYLAGMAASVYDTMPLVTLFGIVSATAIGAAIVLALLIKPVRRMLEAP